MAARPPLIRLLAVLTLALGGAALAAQGSADTLALEPARKIAFTTRTGTWLSLDVSPDGRTLVTGILGDLYLIPIEGGRARRITSGMAFDSQPSFSPDGKRIAFASDRGGSDQLWIANLDGSGARRISDGDDQILSSPAWSADGKSLFVSNFLPATASYELLRYRVADGSRETVAPAKDEAGPKSSLGAWPSPDGRFLYFARHPGRLGDGLPSWMIVRRDIASGEERTVVSAPGSPRPDLILGSYFRPVLSPDGAVMAYGSRHQGRTGIRLLDLTSGQDRWLAFPVQHDALEAGAWEDLLPRYDFTPDGKAIIFTAGARIGRIDIATRAMSTLPFEAAVDLAIGPDLRVDVREESGPVRARLIQNPIASPDGRQIAFSALGRLYLMRLNGRGRLQHLPTGSPAFMPSWSGDGRMLTYVTWTARDGGHVWIRRADGSGRPKRISELPAFYTFPVFAPDGRTIISVRSSNRVRMGSYMEYGPTRQAELVAMRRAGGPSSVLASGEMGGRPHFGEDGRSLFLNFNDGTYRLALDGRSREKLVSVIGPGWYFSEAPGTADDVRISPDGEWALAQIAQQLHLVELPKAGGLTVDLSAPLVRHKKITDVGADYFEWSADGREIHWSVGSTFYRRALQDVVLDSPGAVPTAADMGSAQPGSFSADEARVELPRDVPKGALLLRGATLLTMNGDEAIHDGDLLIVDNKITSLGSRGSIAIPPRTKIVDVAGRFIMPGLIDVHHHYADIRRAVLDFESWGPRANLAYGVTTAFDPSTLSIDTLAYQDAVDTGLMLGSRMPSTGPALFSFNRFQSLAEVRAVLRRYRDHYRTRNLKIYRTGNRRVRQWLAQASREMGMMPTTEGALSLELDLTHVIDGFAGVEHALGISPLGEDVIQLLARSGASYTTTFQIGHGGPQAQDYFITREDLGADPKLSRFTPAFVVAMKTRQRDWRTLAEYGFPALAADAAAIIRAGGLVGIGAHGEMPGIGTHWEMEAHVMGGMTPMEALHAATLGSAKTIGREQEFGSLVPGKFADLIILRSDPRADIRNSLTIERVMMNGRLYDGDSLDELWPRQSSLPEPWYARDVPPDDLPGALGGDRHGQ